MPDVSPAELVQATGCEKNKLGQVARRYCLYIYFLVITAFVVNGLIQASTSGPGNLGPFPHLYAAGKAMAPYQSRALMVPAERWAYANKPLAKMSTHRSGPYSDPGNVPIFVFGVFSVVGCGLLAQSLYRKVNGSNGPLSWLIYPAILVAIVASWTMHNMGDYLYPYDLPSMFFFTSGIWLAWERRWWWLAVMFPIATLNRETTLFLIPLIVLLMRDDEKRWLAPRQWLLITYLAISWIAVTHWEEHRFPGVGSDAIYTPHLHYLTDPIFWPCLLAAVGFLWVFPVFGWRQIDNAKLRSCVILYPLWFGVMAVRGILTESRIFGELIPLTVIIAVIMLEKSQKHGDRALSCH
jgi:hypothetical protein